MQKSSSSTGNAASETELGSMQEAAVPHSSAARRPSFAQTKPPVREHTEHHLNITFVQREAFL